jgi:hypothetical protein
VGQKLLLVRVPTGTPPGTTLHVSVPDEPGRILAAKVPPGNVQEFHVSYEARQQHSPRAGMLPPANAYASGNTIAPQYYNAPSVTGGYHQTARPPTDYYQQQRMSNTPNNNYNNSNNNRNDGGGGFFLPFFGGAALGAAGVATYDHFANMNNNNNYYDYAGDDAAADNTADYGDMGGDDFGGGFD